MKEQTVNLAMNSSGIQNSVRVLNISINALVHR
ncbi:hypothetical protein [Chania multitudinisentens]